MPFVGNQSFNRGEVSPLSIERSDVDFYRASVLWMENWDPLPLGPARRRAPWWYVQNSDSQFAEEPFVITETLFSSSVALYVWPEYTGTNTADFYAQVFPLFRPSDSSLGTYSLWSSSGTEQDKLPTGTKLTLATGVDLPEDFRLYESVTYSLFGPSLFVASPYFPPFRAVDDINTSNVTLESPTWYEELVGSVAADLAGGGSTTTLEGTDTLFTEQLNVKDKIRIQGSLYEINTITDDTTLDVIGADAFTNSFAGERAQVEWDGFNQIQGTVSASGANTSTTTLNGTNTVFTQEVASGDVLFVDGNGYREVDTVTDDTTLEVISADEFTTDFSGKSCFKRETAYFDNENPRLVTVYRNRLIFSSTPSAPVRVWAAKPTDPFVVRPGSTHDNAPIEVDLFAEGASEFLWIAAQDQLFFGGARGEYALVVEGETGLTPTNFVFNRVGSVGGSAIPPEFADATTYFVGPDRRKIYATQFEFQRQGLVTKETTLLNPELVDSPIRSMALRSPREGDSAQRIYLTLESGEVRILTVQEAAGVQAWSRLTVPSDEVFSGTGVVTVRALEGEAFLVFHSGLTGEVNTTLFSLGEYEGTSGVCDFPRDLPVSSGSVSLPHYLRNQTLAVWDENGVFLELIEGTGTLDVSEYTTNRVTVAVPVQNKLQMLPLQMQMSGGAMINRKRRVPRIMLAVRDTNDLQYNGVEMLPNFPNDNPKYQTGTFRHWQLGWSFGDADVIQSNGFYKATLLSVTREVKT